MLAMLPVTGLVVSYESVSKPMVSVSSFSSTWSSRTRNETVPLVSPEAMATVGVVWDVPDTSLVMSSPSGRERGTSMSTG